MAEKALTTDSQIIQSLARLSHGGHVHLLVWHQDAQMLTVERRTPEALFEIFGAHGSTCLLDEGRANTFQMVYYDMVRFTIGAIGLPFNPATHGAL